MSSQAPPSSAEWRQAHSASEPRRRAPKRRPRQVSRRCRRAAPDPGSPPAWAPPQPVPPSWAAGNKQVWDDGWQHWGVWINGVFVPTY